MYLLTAGISFYTYMKDLVRFSVITTFNGPTLYHCKYLWHCIYYYVRAKLVYYWHLCYHLCVVFIETRFQFIFDTSMLFMLILILLNHAVYVNSYSVESSMMSCLFCKCRQVQVIIATAEEIEMLHSLVSIFRSWFLVKVQLSYP